LKLNLSDQIQANIGEGLSQIKPNSSRNIVKTKEEHTAKNQTWITKTFV